MKVKKIGALCRASGACLLYNELGEGGEIRQQWISDGGALWPVSGLPSLREANLSTLFDFTPQQTEKIYIKEQELPGHLYEVLYNARDGEDEMQESPMRITADGRTLMALTVGGGVKWLKAEELKPCWTSQTRLVRRRTEKGDVIAALDGLFLSGIIFPLLLPEAYYREMLRLGTSAPRPVVPPEETEDADEL